MSNMVIAMSMFANNALLGGGVRVWIGEQREIKRRSKVLGHHLPCVMSCKCVLLDSHFESSAMIIHCQAIQHVN